MMPYSLGAYEGPGAELRYPRDLLQSRAVSPENGDLLLTDLLSLRALRADDLPPTAAPAGGVYANDWARFLSWCDEYHVPPIVAEPKTIARFLEAESELGYGLPTIRHRLSAIGRMHKLHDAPLPLSHKDAEVIHSVMRGIQSTYRKQRPRHATTKLLQYVLHSIAEDSLEDVRDRALLGLRIAGAFRVAELARLTFEQITGNSRQIQIDVGGQRYDHRGLVTIFDDGAIRPLRLLNSWIVQSGVQDGSIFREVVDDCATRRSLSDMQIVDVVQARAAAAGYGYQLEREVQSRTTFGSAGS
jgi:integrase